MKKDEIGDCKALNDGYSTRPRWVYHGKLRRMAAFGSSPREERRGSAEYPHGKNRGNRNSILPNQWSNNIMPSASNKLIVFSGTSNRPLTDEIAKNVYVEIIKFHREIIKFDSIDDLILEIKKDKIIGRKFFEKSKI